MKTGTKVVKRTANKVITVDYVNGRPVMTVEKKSATKPKAVKKAKKAEPTKEMLFDINDE
jgi:hypothetical protein